MSATRCKIPIGSFFGHVLVDDTGYSKPGKRKFCKFFVVIEDETIIVCNRIDFDIISAIS